MVDPKPKEIVQAEELISSGKKQEALEIVRNFQETAWVYIGKLQLDKALDIALQCKDLIEKIGEDIDLANNLFLIGQIFLQKENYETSLKYAFRCVELQEKIKNQAGVASGLTLIGWNYWLKGDYNQAIEYCKKSSSIKEVNLSTEVNNLRTLATIFLWKGDLSQSLEYCEKGLKIAKNVDIQAELLYLLGMIFYFKREYNKAKDFYKRCCKLAGKHKIILRHIIALAYHGLININTEENSMNQAKKYLEVLREYATQEKNKIVTKIYSLSKGLVLITESGRIRDRAEAETLFRQIIDDGVSRIQELALYMYALYYLIFMYNEELMMSNDLKTLDDINPLISILSTIAERSQSILFQIAAKIFQANVDLIQMNFDNAKILLIEAQQLAELTNNQFFAQIISNEHDRLLELQDNQEKLKNAKEYRSEKIRLDSFRGITNITHRARSKGIPEFIPEIPVFLLIITESGAPLFSHSFSQELSFEDDIISSFISAFNSFSGELFSKGLDRAKFGDYIILIETVDSYSVCYLFKGQTYSAKQKLANFTGEIQNNPAILQILDKFYKTSQVAELKDVPVLESLMTESFLSKTHDK